MQIDELIEKYLNNLRGAGKASSTQNAYAFDLSKFSEHLVLIGITSIKEITTEIIEDYLFGLKISSTTKQRRKIAVKRFFDFLYRRRLIIVNPALDIESIKVSQNQPEFLSKQQSDKLIETVSRCATPYYKQRDNMLVKLLIQTGLRRAELVSLNISDIDLSKSQIRVRRKGNREEYLIIHHELAVDLKYYLELIHRSTNQPLFMSKKGNRLSASSVWHLIKNYSKQAGLNENVTVHSLRHTFATSLLSKSMPLPYIQALMGHKSSQTTSRYLHIQNNELIEAFNKISFK